MTERVQTFRPGAREASRRRIRAGEVELAGGLPLEHGGHLTPCRIRYELVGPAGAPLVLVLGGISAGRHLLAHAEDPKAGWWEAQAGPGRPLDPGRFRLLSIDWVHGERDGAPLAITPSDQSDALVRLLDRLEIDRVTAGIGASYGGMVLLALAARHPERLDRGLVVAAAHESHPMATALRGLQRKIVRLGMETDRSRDAMVLARSLAMTTYRSDREFEERFRGPPRLEDPGSPARFPVEAYLENRGRSFADRFDPVPFLCLCQSLDLHRIDPGDVSVPLKLVSVDTDTLVPPRQIRALHDGLEGESDLIEVRSIHGHDAFLADEETFAEILNTFLEPHGDPHVSDQ